MSSTIYCKSMYVSEEAYLLKLALKLQRIGYKQLPAHAGELKGKPPYSSHLFGEKLTFSCIFPDALFGVLFYPSDWQTVANHEMYARIGNGRRIRSLGSGRGRLGNGSGDGCRLSKGRAGPGSADFC